jgi:prepilin-type N-terminal cleavage/methylation domain-containing protein
MSIKGKNLKGFTLIEILVVVALIAILAAITIIAINPQQNFADTRNTQRSSDVTQILNAVTQYTSRQGNQLSDVGAVPPCTGTGNQTIGTGGIDLSILVEEYIVAVPEDPLVGTPADTGYRICRTTGGRVQVSAPNAEGGATISVQR